MSNIVDLYREHADDLLGFVGPYFDESCPITADLTTAWGKPQVAFGCGSSSTLRKGRYPLFARVATYAHTHVCIFAPQDICVCTRLHTVCTHAHTHTRLCGCMHARMNTHTHAQTDVRTGERDGLADDRSGGSTVPKVQMEENCLCLLDVRRQRRRGQKLRSAGSHLMTDPYQALPDGQSHFKANTTFRRTLLYAQHYFIPDTSICPALPNLRSSTLIRPTLPRDQHYLMISTTLWSTLPYGQRYLMANTALWSALPQGKHCLMVNTASWPTLFMAINALWPTLFVAINALWPTLLRLLDVSEDEARNFEGLEHTDGRTGGLTDTKTDG